MMPFKQGSSKSHFTVCYLWEHHHEVCMDRIYLLYWLYNGGTGLILWYSLPHSCYFLSSMFHWSIFLSLPRFSVLLIYASVYSMVLCFCFCAGPGFLSLWFHGEVRCDNTTRCVLSTYYFFGCSWLLCSWMNFVFSATVNEIIRILVGVVSNLANLSSQKESNLEHKRCFRATFIKIFPGKQRGWIKWMEE